MSPRTLVTLIPCRIRLTPIILLTEGTAVILTTGSPTPSISDAIVAPQRVLDPQVEVRMTPPTFVLFRSWAISLPILSHTLAVLALPEVE